VRWNEGVFSPFMSKAEEATIARALDPRILVTDHALERAEQSSKAVPWRPADAPCPRIADGGYLAASTRAAKRAAVAGGSGGSPYVAA
jgi:hypothetical protein